MRNQIAAVFHYFEANEAYRDNLAFFLSVGYRPDVDFFILLASECSLTLPKRENITEVPVRNHNHDYGGYGQLVRARPGILDYETLIFVNCSVRGPFMPLGHQASWASLFSDRLADSTHLVGTSISIPASTNMHPRRYVELRGEQPSYAHVQTTSYALTGHALRHLAGSGFFGIEEPLSKTDLIALYEIGLSREILNAGWNMACFLDGYAGIDFRAEVIDPNFTSSGGDPVFDGAYFGRTVHPKEIVFFKSSRFGLSSDDLPSHTYTALREFIAPELADWPETHELMNRMLADVRDAHAVRKRDSKKSFGRRVRQKIKKLL